MTVNLLVEGHTLESIVSSKKFTKITILFLLIFSQFNFLLYFNSILLLPILIPASGIYLIDQPFDILSQKDIPDFKLTKNIGLESVENGKIMEYCDYNSDTKIDLIFLQYDQLDLPIISVFIWNSNNEQFEKFISVRSACQFVDNLIATDWNYDGRIDLITVCKVDKNQPQMSNFHALDKSYFIVTYVQDYNTAELMQVWSSLNALSKSSIQKIPEDMQFSSIHPLLADINNDGLIDMVVQTADQNSHRYVFVNHGEDNMFKPYYWDDLSDFIAIDKPKNYLRIVDPHSSAFADINGDCKSDIIFIVESDNPAFQGSSQMEIWINDLDFKYRKHIDDNPTILHIGSGQISIADFNADGTLDIVVPSCRHSTSHPIRCTSDSIISMTPNIQIPMCPSFWKKGDLTNCRSATDLCRSSPFRINSLQGDKNSMTRVDVLNLVNFDYSDVTPITLRVGDFDGDGYPDLLAVLNNQYDVNHKIQLFRNVHYKYNGISDEKLRYFEPIVELNFKDEISGEIDKSISIYAASFFDIYDDGILDVIIFGVHTQGVNTGKFVSQAFIQSPTFSFSDSLFLKATALNGVCTKACDTFPRFPIPVPYGVSHHGPTFKLTVTNLNGVKSPRISTQLPQSAHTPLQLPFVLFGLGRTNNYIEEFYLGMPSRQKDYFTIWISLIPNSQVIAVPYRLQKPNEWTLELSVCPSKKFWAIFTVTLILLGFVGFAILVLERKEKEEDSEEQRGFRSHFIVN